jgi:hypothetical protein
VAIDLLLALDAECRPRHRIHALGRDVFLAMEAYSVGPIGDANQSAFDLPKHVRIAVEIADREFALTRQLYFVESVWRLLDYDFIPIPQRTGQFRPLRFQDALIFFQINLGHFSIPRFFTVCVFSFVYV